MIKVFMVILLIESITILVIAIAKILKEICKDDEEDIEIL